MTDVIDLDALQPKAAIVKFGGKEITLNPPKTGDVLKLGAAAQKLQNVDELTSEEVDEAFDDIRRHIAHIIPDLAGEQLNMQQILVLIKAISDMAIPPDAKELAARGITVDSDPKAA